MVIYIFKSLIVRSDLACKIAYDAVKIVTVETDGRKEIDIKRYAKVEKVRKVETILVSDSWWVC